VVKAREEAREPYDKGLAPFLKTIENNPEMKKAMVKMVASDPDMKNVMKEILKELMEKGE
jgi:hypothetical protein